MIDRHIGVVTWFDKDKGYGFIRPESGDDVLVQSCEIKGVTDTLTTGQRVSFSIVANRKAPEAHDITLL